MQFLFSQNYIKFILDIIAIYNKVKYTKKIF